MQIGNEKAVSAPQATHTPFTAGPTPVPQSEPVPLIRPREDAEALPLDHLGALRQPAEAIARLTSAPVEIAFQSVLATASLATQHVCDVETLAGTAPLSLFLLTVAASGERKSSCDRLAAQAVHDWEEEHFADFLLKRRAYELDLAVHEAQMRAAIKSRADGEPIVDVDPQQPPVPPIVPRKLLPDMTFEGLLRHFDEGNPSIGIFADEGGQFFGGHVMGRDNALKTISGLSKLWDAAPLNRTRAGAPQGTYRHRRGSLHLMIQPGIAEGVLGDRMLIDQGFLSRTLIAWPKSRIGSRFVARSESDVAKCETAKTHLDRFNLRIRALLETASDTHTNPLELKPRCLPLSDVAHDLLVGFADQIEVAQADGGLLSGIRGFASKAAEQAARLSGILTVLEDETAAPVSEAAMLNATQIVAWYVNEAQRLLHAGRVDPELEKAQKLLDWLWSRFPAAPFDKRSILRRGPGSIRDAKIVSRLLQILETHGHILRGEEGTLIDGTRAKLNWRLVCHD